MNDLIRDTECDCDDVTIPVTMRATIAPRGRRGGPITSVPVCVDCLDSWVQIAEETGRVLTLTHFLHFEV